MFLQLPDSGGDAVHAVLADHGQPLRGVIPFLRQGEHEGQQPFGLEGHGFVPQMVVGHDGVVFRLFYAENCHDRPPSKSVDFQGKSAMYPFTDGLCEIIRGAFKKRQETDKTGHFQPILMQ